MTKSCSNINCPQINPQSIENFYRRGGKEKNKYRSRCKHCIDARTKEEKIEDNKLYYSKNKEKSKRLSREYNTKNKERIAQKTRLYRLTHKKPRIIKEYILKIEKICPKCGVLKNLDKYPKNKRTKDKHGSYCSECMMTIGKQWRNNNVEKLKIKRQEEQNSEKYKQWRKEYYLKNREKHLLGCKIRNQKNKKQRTEKHLFRYHNDLIYNLKHKLRGRINKIIKRGDRPGSAIKMLGCSIENFIKYIESKFQPNMTWENYGKNGWEIDHIRPLCSFDLKNEEDFKNANHYSNLQPLWHDENLKKSGNFDFKQLLAGKE